MQNKRHRLYRRYTRLIHARSKGKYFTKRYEGYSSLIERRVFLFFLLIDLHINDRKLSLRLFFLFFEVKDGKDEEIPVVQYFSSNHRRDFSTRNGWDGMGNNDLTSRLRSLLIR